MIEATLCLLTLPGYFDVAVRDLRLMLGALALGRRSHNFDPPNEIFLRKRRDDRCGKFGSGKQSAQKMER